MSAAEQQVGAGVATTMAALKPAGAPEESMPQVFVGFTSLQAFQLTWRVAGMFAESSIVPQRFQNNRGNCAIALEMAHRIGASPLMVMQNLYVVHGQPGWSAKFLIACFNQCGRFSSIKYRFQGTRGKDDWGCVATATELSTGEKLEGPLITIELAKKEGWYGRKDSKWQTMPEQMLRYRAGAWFINTTAPEISMGLLTAEEIHDTFEATPKGNGTFAVDLDSLRGESHTGASTQPSGAGASADSGKPSYDRESALQALKEAGSLEDLKAAWTSIIEYYDAAKQDLPPEIEPLFKDRKAAFEQQADSAERNSTGKLKL